MKDNKLEIEVDGKKYLLAFNLNVMQAIQAEYGSIKAWGEKVEAGDDGMDAKAVTFGFTEMLNEGRDIENEDLPTEQQKPMFTQRQVGRLITSMGLGGAAGAINEMVIQSTKDDHPKNASSTKTKTQQ